MKRKGTIFFVLIFLVLFSIVLSSNSIYAKKNKDDLINKIVLSTDSKIVEYGVNCHYKTIVDGRVECNNWLKNMGLFGEIIKSSRNKDLSDQTEISLINEAKNLKNNNDKLRTINKITIDSNGVYCREFNKGQIYGYIESVKSNNEYIIYIYIQIEDSKDNLAMLKSQVEKASNNNKFDMVVNQYVKAKLQDNDIAKVNKTILNIINKSGATNVNTVSFNNGYSTVAYTKRYNAILDNNKKIDFNFAVCKYPSGSYIVIGIPVISITY
ncbi:MAG: YwmB family TATA-box binding protein [Bacillota bacterium]|nr:YwmB family TATA-box binding protein [Bacillota bacterium]